MRHIAIVPEKEGPDPSELNRTAAAIQMQISRDVGPIWGLEATVHAFTRLEDVPVGYWPVVLSWEELGRLEGLRIGEAGQPYGRVQLGPLWSLSASRLCIDMVVNPTGTRSVVARLPDGPHRSGLVEALVEPSAPCGGAGHAYRIHGVVVADFCTPAFFESQYVSGARYSFAGSVARPMAPLPGGYLAWYDPVSGQYWLNSHFGAELRTTRLDRATTGGDTAREMISAFAPLRAATGLALGRSAAEESGSDELGAQLKAQRLRLILDGRRPIILESLPAAAPEAATATLWHLGDTPVAGTHTGETLSAAGAVAAEAGRDPAVPSSQTPATEEPIPVTDAEVQELPHSRPDGPEPLTQSGTVPPLPPRAPEPPSDAPPAERPAVPREDPRAPSLRAVARGAMPRAEASHGWWGNRSSMLVLLGTGIAAALVLGALSRDRDRDQEMRTSTGNVKVVPADAANLRAVDQGNGQPPTRAAVETDYRAATAPDTAAPGSGGLACVPDASGTEATSVDEAGAPTSERARRSASSANSASSASSARGASRATEVPQLPAPRRERTSGKRNPGARQAQEVPEPEVPEPEVPEPEVPEPDDDFTARSLPAPQGASPQASAPGDLDTGDTVPNSKTRPSMMELIESRQ